MALQGMYNSTQNMDVGETPGSLVSAPTGTPMYGMATQTASIAPMMPSTPETRFDDYLTSEASKKMIADQQRQQKRLDDAREAYRASLQADVAHHTEQYIAAKGDLSSIEQRLANPQKSPMSIGQMAATGLGLLKGQGSDTYAGFEQQNAQRDALTVQQDQAKRNIILANLKESGLSMADAEKAMRTFELATLDDMSATNDKMIGEIGQTQRTGITQQAGLQKTEITQDGLTTRNENTQAGLNERADKKIKADKFKFLKTWSQNEKFKTAAAKLGVERLKAMVSIAQNNLNQRENSQKRTLDFQERKMYFDAELRKQLQVAGFDFSREMDSYKQEQITDRAIAQDTRLRGNIELSDIQDQIKHYYKIIEVSEPESEEYKNAEAQVAILASRKRKVIDAIKGGAPVKKKVINSPSRGGIVYDRVKTFGQSFKSNFPGSKFEQDSEPRAMRGGGGRGVSRHGKGEAGDAYWRDANDRAAKITWAISQSPSLIIDYAGKRTWRPGRGWKSDPKLDSSQKHLHIEMDPTPTRRG